MLMMAGRFSVPIETEIKLQLMNDPGDRVMRSTLRRAIDQPMSRAKTILLLSIYFDTPELKLSERHIALRLRKVGARWLQTMKFPTDHQSGIQTYHEFEAEVSKEKPDMSVLPPKMRQVVWLTKHALRLRPIFETKITRTIWMVGAEGAQTELAWDRGEIRVGKRSAAVNELELELKSGESRRLFILAEKLVQSLPVRLGDSTKAARANALARGEMPAAIKSTSLKLSARSSVANAFRDVVNDCIAHMRANERAILAQGQPEAIHQFRVALRRLRAIISAFRDLIDEAELEKWLADLRWVHQAFGRARDLDVFVSETLNRLATLYPADATLKRFIALAEIERGEARERALLAINDRRYTALLLRLAHALEDQGWMRPAVTEILAKPARGYAQILLRRRYKRVRKIGDRWPDLDIADLHRLRLLVKKLRYLAVSFAALFPKEAVTSFLLSLEALQDCLGALNDSVIGRKYAAEIAVAAETTGALASDGVSRVSGQIAGWHARATDESLRHFSENWTAFLARKRFWET